MQHSPIKITDASGTPKTILPFARPWISAEDEYRQQQLARGVRPPETIAEAYSLAINPNGQDSQEIKPKSVPVCSAELQNRLG